MQVDNKIRLGHQFGAASFTSQTIEGHWQHGGRLYRDDLACVVVDMADTPENRKWMRAYKARWKERRGQLKSWMVSYPNQPSGHGKVRLERPVTF